MSKYVKIQSQQGGGFNRNQNLVDFKFGYNGETIDMSKSYVNIMSRCVVNGGNSDAIYNSKIQYLNDAGQVQDLSPPTIALVKDCALSCQKAGNLEHIRRVDALRANLKPLTQTIEEYDSTLYKTTGQHKISDFISSPWVQLKGEGNVKSKYVSAPVQIQLSDLFELGNSVVSTKDLGEMRIHLELQAQRFSAVQTPKSNEVMGDAYYQQFEDVLQTEQSNITTLTTRQVFSGTLESSPYFVGMELLFTSTGVGATNINESAIITDLQLIKDADNVQGGKLILTLDRQLGDALTAGQSQTAIACVPTNCDSVSLVFDYAELVLRIVPEIESSKEIVYSTWTLEETNGN